MNELRVLDWGCGRGITVAKLLYMGVDAYGVDVDPGPINNGLKFLKSCSPDSGRRLICIDSSCRTSFPDEYFHIILSNQVLEHVSNLETLVRESARITMRGGSGLHFYPAKWRFVEPHLMVPFVHWLPKNRLRFWYLYFMLYRIPVWTGLEEKSRYDRACAYFKYSIEKTYYRKFGMVKDLFEKRGFAVSMANSGWSGGGFQVYFRSCFLLTAFRQRLMEWWAVSFGEVSILIHKN